MLMQNSQPEPEKADLKAIKAARLAARQAAIYAVLYDVINESKPFSVALLNPFKLNQYELRRLANDIQFIRLMGRTIGEGASGKRLVDKATLKFIRRMMAIASDAVI